MNSVELKNSASKRQALHKIYSFRERDAGRIGITGFGWRSEPTRSTAYCEVTQGFVKISDVFTFS